VADGGIVCCRLGSAMEATELPPGRRREFEGGVFPRFPPPTVWRSTCQVYPQDKTSKQAYRGGGGSGGGRGTTAIEPAP
jgi:hypothetical protein